MKKSRKIRSDSMGDGHFGSPRDGGARFHDGVDFVVTPGEPIILPFDAYIEKIEIPYATDQQWKGIQFKTDLVRIEIWYMDPNTYLVGQSPSKGCILGTAQDISQKYSPDMTPHIHVRASLLPMTYLLKRLYSPTPVYFDCRILEGF